MKREITLDDFIDALIAAREKVKLAQGWDAKLAAYQAQAAALHDDVHKLNKQRQDISVDLTAAMEHADRVLASKQTACQQAFDQEKAKADAALALILSDAEKAKQKASDSIIRYAQEEAVAKRSAELAAKELAAIQSELEEARKTAERLSKFAPMARA